MSVRCLLSVVISATCASSAFSQAPPPLGVFDDPAPAFAAPSSANAFGTPNATPTLFGVGDVTGDAIPDLLGGSDPFVMVGDGHGRFSRATSFASGGLTVLAGGVSSRVVADLDGDGDADVASFNGFLEIRRSTSAAGFTLTQSIFVAGGGALAGGDVDGDGDFDLVVAMPPISNQAGTTPQAARLYLNDGLGSFSFAAAAVLPAGNGAALALADMDTDSDLDLVLTTATGFSVASNLGGLSFGPPATTVIGTVGLGFAPGFRIAPLNGDALNDLVYWNGSSTLFVQMAAAGGFLAGVSYSAAGGVVDVAAVDLESDGVRELVLATTAGLEIVRVVAGGSAATQLGFHRMNAIRLAPGDLDLDGDVDVAVEVRTNPAGFSFDTYNGRHLRLLFNDGLGGTVLEQPPLPPQALVGPAVVGDFDGDGDQDLLGVAQDGSNLGALALARNDGTGVFTWERPACASCPVFSLSGAIGAALDIDLDGDSDYALVIPNSGAAGAILPLINLGAAGFAAGAPIPVAVYPATVVASDFDLDGDQDLVVSEATTVGAQLLCNIGGTFAAPVALGVPQCTDLAAIDADLDGDVDLAIAGATSRLLLNDGTGNFTPDPSFPSLSAIRTSAWDVDNDGTPEIYLDGKLYRRTTTGVWSLLGDVPTGAAPGAGAWEFSSVDFVLSGVTDTFVSSGVLHWGQSPGVVASIVLPVPTGGEAPIVADLDRDGDLDLIGPGAVLSANRLQHLTLDGALRPGRPWRVVLRGAAGGAAYLFVSLPTAFGGQPLAPYGTLFLDPAGTLLMSAGVLGADGVFVATGLLPASAATLLGQPFILQGFVDTTIGPRLTNARRATIVAY